MAPSVTTAPGPSPHQHELAKEDQQRMMAQMMEDMSKYYLVEHIVTNQNQWDAMMQNMQADPTMYPQMVEGANKLGLHPHSSLPTSNHGKHFCMWETRGGVNSDVLQEFLDTTLTQGACRNELNHIPFQKAPQGLPDPHFPNEGARVLLFEFEVESGFTWLAEYHQHRNAGMHKSLGITYEFASLDPSNSNKVFVVHQFASAKTYDAFMTKYQSDEFKDIKRKAGVKKGTERIYQGKIEIQRSNAPGGMFEFMKQMSQAQNVGTDEFACVSFETDNKERFLESFEKNEAMGAHRNVFWRAATSSLDNEKEIKCFFRFPQGACDPWLANWWGQMELATKTIGSPEAISKMNVQKFNLNGAATESAPLSFFDM